jgi:hypothetical protein
MLPKKRFRGEEQQHESLPSTPDTEERPKRLCLSSSEDSLNQSYFAYPANPNGESSAHSSPDLSHNNLSKKFDPHKWNEFCRKKIPVFELN